MKRTRPRTILVALGGVLLSVAILLSGPKSIDANIPAVRAQVVTGEIVRSTTPASGHVAGTLSPRQTLSLTSQVPGEVVWVSEKLVAGGRVEAGDVLFRIDPKDYEIAVASAEAKYAQAEARVNLEMGNSENAKLEWAKWQSISGERARASSLALREPQRAEVLALAAMNRAELEKAKLDLSRSIVRSPWDASIIDVSAVEGQVMSTGDVAAILYPLDHGVVELQVPLRTIRLLGDDIHSVALRPVDEPESQPVFGKYQGIVHSLSEDTRLAKLRVLVSHPLDNRGWVYGMHLSATIVGNEQLPRAQVPADLMVGGNLVWVYRDSQAIRHPLRPIQSAGSNVLVEDNFQPNDRLILERPIGLSDGAVVIAEGI